MCLEVKKETIKKWAKTTMPDYKCELAEEDYILFSKDNTDCFIKTKIRVQFRGTMLGFGCFSVVFKLLEKRVSILLIDITDENFYNEYYDDTFVICLYDFPYSNYIFPESVKNEAELEIYLSEFYKCVKFYETEIFPKLTDIHFLAEFVGSVPFENAFWKL